MRVGFFGEVTNERVLILQKVGVLEWVGLVGHLLSAFGSDILPVVGGLLLDEQFVLFEGVDRGSHLGITLEYLVQKITSSQVDAFLVQAQLSSQNLLLQLHWIIFLQEGERAKQ